MVRESTKLDVLYGPRRPRFDLSLIDTKIDARECCGIFVPIWSFRFIWYTYDRLMINLVLILQIMVKDDYIYFYKLYCSILTIRFIYTNHW